MKKLMNRYKEISYDILESLKEDEIEKAVEFISMRENILKQIDAMEEKEDINLSSLGIISVENEIKSIIMKKQNDILIEIAEIKQNKVANSVYGRQFKDIFFINKQA